MEYALSTSPPSHTQRENPNVAKARRLVLAYGWNSTAFQIVNPGIERWFTRDAEAVVGYVTANKVRVVAGSPVCEEERLADVIDKFEANAARAGERVCYFAAERRLESILSHEAGYSKVLIGAQPSWHPAFWPDTVASHKSLRAQLNRARNKDVRVKEWSINDARNHPALQACLDDWLATKGLPPLHFMVEAATLSRLENRRVFVATQAEIVQGFVVLSPISQRNGWLFEQFPHCRTAPNGTVELLIDAAMRTLADENCDYATLGLSPLSKRALSSADDQSLLIRMLFAWMRKHGSRFYNFEGLDRFKAKLRPERWEPVFAVSNEPRFSLTTLYAIAGAFSGDHPFRLLAGGIARAVSTEARWLKRRIFG
ncbi:MAG: DUF2156 domain-containing protein [Acidobacteria bacterium]|nr:DUF2156 domain-containing protein [Acidobacteriota bacterium]